METLGQYFSYTNEPEQIRDIFLSLDNQLKIIHERGYSVEINSSSIVSENGDFGFSHYNYGLSPSDKKKNIEDLAKLALGTYFSLPTGSFSDYTHLPTDYIRDNFALMEDSVLKASNNDNYYREVLVNGHYEYYNDYLKRIREVNDHNRSNVTNRVLSYSTKEGRAMTNNYDNNEESAFINIAFYPIIVTLFTILSYMVYILVK